MKAIDFRVRPPYDSFIGLFSYDKWPGVLYESLVNMGIEEPAPASYRHNSIEEYLQECEQSEIIASVVACRDGADMDAFEELANKYPGKFYLFPYANLADVEETKKTVERYVLNSKYGKGVTIEPGIPVNGKTYQVNDEIFFPVYKYLEENNIPIMLTLAIMTVPLYDPSIPYYVDQVLDKFPKLKIIIGHAGAPWGRDFGAMLMKRPNLYLAVDTQLLGGVGSYDYREAQKWNPDRFLFASSYPVTPPQENKVAYEHSGILQGKHLEDFLYNNAVKLLGIE